MAYVAYTGEFFKHCEPLWIPETPVVTWVCWGSGSVLLLRRLPPVFCQGYNMAVGLDNSIAYEGRRDVVGCDAEFAVRNASAWDIKDSIAKSY